MNVKRKEENKINLCCEDCGEQKYAKAEALRRQGDIYSTKPFH